MAKEYKVSYGGNLRSAIVVFQVLFYCLMIRKYFVVVAEEENIEMRMMIVSSAKMATIKVRTTIVLNKELKLWNASFVELEIMPQKYWTSVILRKCLNSFFLHAQLQQELEIPMNVR